MMLVIFHKASQSAGCNDDCRNRLTSYGRHSAHLCSLMPVLIADQVAHVTTWRKTITGSCCRHHTDVGSRVSWQISQLVLKTMRNLVVYFEPAETCLTRSQVATIRQFAPEKNYVLCRCWVIVGQSSVVGRTGELWTDGFSAD